jgi:hypothetical protein
MDRFNIRFGDGTRGHCSPLRGVFRVLDRSSTVNESLRRGRHQLVSPAIASDGREEREERKSLETVCETQDTQDTQDTQLSTVSEYS